MNQTSQTLNSGGIPPSQLSALVALRNEDIKGVAIEIGENDRRLSETISRARRNERVRVKLSLYLNMTYEALWGGEPNWNAVAGNLRVDYETRFGIEEAAVA